MSNKNRTNIRTNIDLRKFIWYKIINKILKREVIIEMKFVHIADMHFDSAFCALAGNEKFAIERRLEQRKAMKEVVEYIKQNNIPYFFIAGDLYEQEYIRKSTVEYI